MRTWITLGLMCLLWIAPIPDVHYYAKEAVHQDTARDLEKRVDRQLRALSLEEKIGQMFVVGFPGTSIEEARLAELIQTYHVGGVILYGDNIKNAAQLLQLNNTIKTLNQKSSIPLFLSTDEEGGRVSRLPQGKTVFPPNKVIGVNNNPALSYEIGKVIGEELSLFGFNMDFAPVLDVHSHHQNTVIGDRAFSADPDIVGTLGTATMRGLRSARVIPVVKHFPGHGGTTTDSHVGLPVGMQTTEQLRQFELKPFRQAIASGADVIMVAHILYPNVTTDKKPASLAKELVTDLLRNEMSYKGVVITDDLEMGAIANQYSPAQAAVLAVQAGVDLLLLGHSFEKEAQAYSALLHAVKIGEIPVARIDESVKRILTLKAKYTLTDKPLDPSRLQHYPNVKHQEIAERIQR
ncbi:beta-N-acetylhexosaminidase [Ectobacillus sp. JY-23]|uniref:beta-N-acetylhexosaminidase n=1 Tax=Ectobacillus sp. JY-23 TaxID=2933872 RepID=UPI001FF46AE4|nr:beta-N-acetylhexosaminidase [Ectobacillus sp. JY-23]UOY92294.1 beta-N-acetylhexosaminidase [Ectobacillus sp. JY-23]